MKIVVIGDTHIHDNSEKLPAQLLKDIKTADLIIHTGDITTELFLNSLKSIKPVKACAGNMDSPELKKKLKKTEEVKSGNFKIGITHGFGAPDKVIENIKTLFDETYDLVAFGHSHKAFNQKMGNTIFLNPGSPTDKVFATYNSYGIITINDSIKAEIIKLQS